MNRLVAFLYIVGRDYLRLGEIEKIMADHAIKVDDRGADPSYSNPHLEAYARAVAYDLLRPPASAVETYITFRGSAEDLATDVHALLNDDQRAAFASRLVALSGQRVIEVVSKMVEKRLAK